MYTPKIYRFPIEKLPTPFYEAVVDVHRRTDAPPETVTADTFAIASTITQQRHKLQGPNGNVMPMSQNTLSLAPSASGKGESYRCLMTWPAHFDIDESALALKKIAIGDLILQNESYTSLIDRLDGHHKSASIQLEDGYSFLTGPMMKPDVISYQTQAWSGASSIRFGRHRNVKHAVEPCLTIGLRLPPDLFYDFNKRNKGECEKLGLWGRSLVFCHDPERFPIQPWYPPDSARRASYLPFMERMYELAPYADGQQSSENAPRQVISMDTYADAHLREIAYWIKGQMNGEFRDIQRAAGRAAENTLRLAGNFHLVCNGEGPISRDMIERAWAFVEWSLTQYRNVFVYATQPPPKPAKIKPMKPPKPPQHQQRLNNDMRFVLDCIASYSNSHPQEKIPLGIVALLSGMPLSRFNQTIAWLLTARLIELDGTGQNMTIRSLPMPSFNAYGLPMFPGNPA